MGKRAIALIINDVSVKENQMPGFVLSSMVSFSLISCGLYLGSVIQAIMVSESHRI